MKSICVFCGSRAGRAPAYLEAARGLGTAVAASGVTLVYGGGGRGMMGALADAALAAGGRVTVSGPLASGLRVLRRLRPPVEIAYLQLGVGARCGHQTGIDTVHLQVA